MYVWIKSIRKGTAELSANIIKLCSLVHQQRGGRKNRADKRPAWRQCVHSVCCTSQGNGPCVIVKKRTTRHGGLGINHVESNLTRMRNLLDVDSGEMDEPRFSGAAWLNEVTWGENDTSNDTSTLRWRRSVRMLDARLGDEASAAWKVVSPRAKHGKVTGADWYLGRRGVVNHVRLLV